MLELCTKNSVMQGLPAKVCFDHARLQCNGFVKIVNSIASICSKRESSSQAQKPSLLRVASKADEDTEFDTADFLNIDTEWLCKSAGDI